MRDECGVVLGLLQQAQAVSADLARRLNDSRHAELATLCVSDLRDLKDQVGILESYVTGAAA